MLKATDFHLAIVQLVIFTPEVSTFSTPKALATILGEFSHIYDGDVQTTPSSDQIQIPPDFPKVILQSKDQSLRLEIAPLRITSQWAKLEQQETELQNIISQSLEVLEHYIHNLEVKVGRLGLVLIRIHQSENPSQLIIERLCKPELQNTIFKNTKNLDFRNHQRIILDNCDVNSVMTCKTGLMKINDIESQGVIVEQDLNTLAEEMEQRSFKIEDLKKYFQLAAEEAELNLKIHFPEEV
ncbi:hypothetical protein WJM97_21330 [Okeanomitos corallinicola TIOX110]|uniref:Uncharacterized protein n=1 Tax=Okeanomitos corallinicola TIOX110 TaxID=3133117 RepID=A0ABZ2URF6_9CYAN